MSISNRGETAPKAGSVISGVSVARRAALKALMAHRMSDSWPGKTLRAFVEKTGASQRDAALAEQIVNGVMQNMMLCDHYISRFSAIDMKKIEPRVLDILRISVYQIIFLDRVPNSAAVNEGAALVRERSNPRAVGYANAILRKIAAASETGGLPAVEGDRERILSVKYSHPEWMVRELCGILGDVGAEALFLEHNAPGTMTTAQVNTLRADTEDALTALKADGAETVPHEWLDDCVTFRGGGDVARLEAFRKGYIYIQDAAARLAVMAADPKPGDFIIDGCAAPGGKSFAAAIAMKNTGKIAAFDVNGAKLRQITDGAARLGINIIEAATGDASSAVDGLAGKADVVFADVPCSGSGVIRKKPEIRYKTESDVDSLCDIQRRILSALSEYVKPGGALLYSTCSVLKRENEDIVNLFLDENKEFLTESFSIPGAGAVPEGMTTLWPHINGTDGFFICRMKRGG